MENNELKIKQPIVKALIIAAVAWVIAFVLQQIVGRTYFMFGFASIIYILLSQIINMASIIGATVGYYKILEKKDIDYAKSIVIVIVLSLVRYFISSIILRVFGIYGFFLTIIGILLLIGTSFVVVYVNEPKKIVENNEGANLTINSNDAYISLVTHVLLLLFTFGIWQYIWIYRTTKYLNCVEGTEYRNPTTKLLLCMFIPFYYIYWVYKSSERIDKKARMHGMNSDLSTICLILAIFVNFIPPILMQDKINNIIDAER